MRKGGRIRQRRVGMENIERRRKVRRDIKVRAVSSTRVQCDELGLSGLGALGRQQSDPVSQLRETSGQPDDDSLSPAIPPYREPAVEVEGDMHPAAMYRPYFVLAKGPER
jgi:hypothetical protein